MPGRLCRSTNQERERRCVEECGGIINKYIGDSIMAIFGIPAPRTDVSAIASDARGAVRCALDMRRELAKLNAEWKARGLAPIQMRVGIHTGPLVAGSIGNQRRLEYTVLGDTVNIASRLESFEKEVMDTDIAADGCRILIGPRTFELVSGYAKVRLVSDLPLKGRNQPMNVYGVIDGV